MFYMIKFHMLVLYISNLNYSFNLNKKTMNIIKENTYLLILIILFFKIIVLL